VDVSDGLVADSKRPPNLESFLSDSISVPAARGTVNLAYSSHVMEHLHLEDAYEQSQNAFATFVPGVPACGSRPTGCRGRWTFRAASTKSPRVCN